MKLLNGDRSNPTGERGFILNVSRTVKQAHLLNKILKSLLDLDCVINLEAPLMSYWEDLQVEERVLIIPARNDITSETIRRRRDKTKFVATLLFKEMMKLKRRLQKEYVLLMKKPRPLSVFIRKKNY